MIYSYNKLYLRDFVAFLALKIIFFLNVMRYLLTRRMHDAIIVINIVFIKANNDVKSRKGLDSANSRSSHGLHAVRRTCHGMSAVQPTTWSLGRSPVHS